jgi:hypothetical protein
MSLAIQLEVYRSKHTRLAARLVLLAMADAANDTHRMCWESVGTIASKANIGERQTYNVLRDLEERRIVERVPDEEKPPEALRYKSVVRRIRPVEDWLEEAAQAEVDMQNLQGPNQDKAPLQTLQGAEFSSNPNNQLEVRDIEETSFLPPRRSARSDPGGAEEISIRPGAKGWDAVRAPRKGGRKKTRKQVAEEAALAEKELDPAYVVAQALGEGDPGGSPAGRLPASDGDLAPPVQRPREKRSRRPSEELAEFFGKRAEEVGHPVPGATNLQALSGQFGRWMREGLERQVIRQMIITYWSVSWNRSENIVAWKDFLGARGLLTERLGKAESDMEKHRHDESYWD